MLQNLLQNSSRRGSFWEDPIRDALQYVADGLSNKSDSWVDAYINSSTGREYEPHNDDERKFVYETDGWRYGLIKGGEGGGKSVAGIIKALERVKLGLSGVMVSPDLPHFKRSLWAEFRRWCPWDYVTARQRYMANPDWFPHEPFMLSFTNGATIFMGGIESPMSWEGANVNWAMFDEARRHKEPAALKVLDGRVRIPGKYNTNPQLWLTTTPMKHWLFDYFGWQLTCLDCGSGFDADKENEACPVCGSENTVADESDEYLDFKRDSFVVTLLTVDNERNLGDGFAKKRRQSLTNNEAQVLLEAKWVDIADNDYFLPSISMWDACADEDMPPLNKKQPLVIAADAAVNDDTFALVGVAGVSDGDNEIVGVYITYAWSAEAGGEIDFSDIDNTIRDLCKRYNVLEFAYDPYQLHDMGMRLEKDRRSGKIKIGAVRKFSQNTERTIADTQLLGRIIHQKIVHDGTNKLLRKHVQNANKKTVDKAGRNIRLIKRTHRKKIDLAVALSMAANRYESYPLSMRLPKKMQFLKV